MMWTRRCGKRLWSSWTNHSSRCQYHSYAKSYLKEVHPTATALIIGRHGSVVTARCRGHSLSNHPDQLIQIDCAGLQCRACTEKRDFVQRALEVIHLPPNPRASASGGSAAGAGAGLGDAPKDIDEILSRLKGMPGMENMEVCP